MNLPLLIIKSYLILETTFACTRRQFALLISWLRAIPLSSFKSCFEIRYLSKATAAILLKLTSTFSYFRTIALISIFAKFDATILRLPCLDYADFTIVHEHKFLKGSIIATHHGVTDISCMIKCVENQKCRSYNIDRASGECQLNSKVFGDADSVLSDGNGWLYKSTDYNETLVSCNLAALFSWPRCFLDTNTGHL